MTGWRAAFLALLVLPGWSARGETPARHLFLIQDSGWMEPFLTAGDSQFRPFVEALIAAAGAQADTVVIAAFDQDGQVPGRTSPRILYQGRYSADRARAAVAAIDLPRKAGGRAYADADFNGALLGGIRIGLQGRDGVIWMVTNNKNAPGNSAAVERNTAAFYASLRASRAIPRIVAYPVRMPLTGRTFSEAGFVVYGIGYGPGGERALEAALGAPGLRTLFSHPAVTLKPVPGGALALSFDRLDSGGLEAGLEDGVLVVRGADAAGGTVLRFTAHLTNGLYPQRVATAALALDWSEGQTGTDIARAAVEPASLADLAPQARSAPLGVTLSLPPIPRPPGFAGLLTNRRDVDGTLTLRLSDLHLTLDPDFLERVRPIFASRLLVAEQPVGPGAADAAQDGLPGLFGDYRGVSEATVRLPVRIETAFPPWPLAAASGGTLALTAALGLGAAAFRRARTCTVTIGGFAKRVSLRPFRPAVLRAPDGSRWRVRARPWGAPRVTRIDEPGTGA
ncbi:hypothetical protein ACLBX9_04480 [Methylobacterium sp. A49B]